MGKFRIHRHRRWQIQLIIFSILVMIGYTNCTGGFASLDSIGPDPDLSSAGSPMQSIVSGKTYRILSSCDYQKAIGVLGGSKELGPNLVLESKTNSLNQVFRLETDSLGGYKFTNLNSGRSFGVSGGGRDVGTSISQWDYLSPPVPYQSFQLELVTSDASLFRIKTFAGLYVEPQSGPALPAMIQQNFSEICSQKFRFEESPVSGDPDPSTETTTTTMPGSTTSTTMSPSSPPSNPSGAESISANDPRVVLFMDPNKSWAQQPQMSTQVNACWTNRIPIANLPEPGVFQHLHGKRKFSKYF
jgi:hypothetical protein